VTATVTEPSDAATFRIAGDQAVVVELGDDISRATNARVRRLDRALRESAIEGVIDTVPSYRSLLVYYEPRSISHTDLIEMLKSILSEASGANERTKRWHLPVLYGAECAADLSALAGKVGHSEEEIIRIHSGAEYMVYMVGFSPGFSYLGELPRALEVPRKLVPARSVPANSIQIGGAQTAVSSMPMPSGWYIVGRTAVWMYDLRRTSPFLLAAGDLVRFHPVGAGEFAALGERAERGELEPDWEWTE
jgi:KipI family sensor histidine kinase inhibitor